MIHYRRFPLIALSGLGAICALPAAHAVDPSSDEPVDSRCREEPREYVPIALASSEAAARVAEAYFAAVFGEREELPPPYFYRFDVKLQAGVWSVDRLISAPPRSDGLPTFVFGGGRHILLCQSNGRVLELYATQ